MAGTGTLKVTTPSDREITMTRVFDAPRRRVFDAHTRPELLKRWLGVRGGWTLEVCEVDLKVGGKYRYVWRKGATGTDMGMGGVFREIVPGERIVCTETFDDAWYPGEALVTTVLVEKDGKTTLTSTTRYESKEARDAVLATPMERGVAESYDKLVELLAA
ncbi:SRPBCC family protein [Pyxidicoccus xibeiensis]|uniref:SRPBCC family protein n=1 Tax=Pyxidicoccus xibeiensis TaxID=2906759 RepID=UPI0020A7C84B|nr:SRPBCC family protein [Pyxidicoccus xibeiensis]MCP3144041.1 SRPBCC family protein [Pyxidicoccus xibeiensis]